MSGFSLKCLDQNADRISIQSTQSPTWSPERRRYFFSKPRVYDVAVTPDELIVLKTRGRNRIVLTSRDADLIVRSTRRGVVYLSVHYETLINLYEDETLTIRRVDARDPTRGHRPPTEDEIARGATP